MKSVDCPSVPPKPTSIESTERRTTVAIQIVRKSDWQHALHLVSPRVCSSLIPSRVKSDMGRIIGPFGDVSEPVVPGFNLCQGIFPTGRRPQDPVVAR